jgi:hypothetical protein
MTKRNIFLFLIFVFSLAACQDEGKETIHLEGHPLAGQWSTINFPIAADLRINEDASFHVDLMISEGIEIEGLTEIGENKQISFINSAGSDSVASNPYPGVYRYSLNGDTLSFTVLDDTISRRQLLLSAAWLKQ